MVPLPFFVDNGTMRYLTDLFIIMSVAQLWNLLAGFGGVVSIGQHAFVGAGGYAFFGLTTHLGLNPFLSMALTLPFGALLSLPVFAILSRMRVAYFAIGSWVLAEVFMLVAGKLPGFGGGSGISLRPQIVKAFGASTSSRVENIYWLSFAILVLVIFLIILVMHSRRGYSLRAMRDNETAAMALGVNPNAVKAMLFVVSGAFLSLLGAVNTLQKLRVNPSGFFQPDRLDGVHHLHGRDRRHGPDHRADHWRCALCAPAGKPLGIRADLYDHPRRCCDWDDAL